MRIKVLKFCLLLLGITVQNLKVMGWRVHSCSSESPVHSAGNVLLEELYRIWQTKEPCDEAWLILEAEPPTPFDRLEIVNGGSSLLEVYGLSAPEEGGGEEEEEREELLLSTQQVMTLKDLTNKCNRNRSFAYTVPQKLSPIATQKRWKRVRIVCRQPFGTLEHRSCIGLSRVNISCSTQTNSSSLISEASLQQEIKEGCMPNVLTRGHGRDLLSSPELIATLVVNSKNQSLNFISDVYPGGMAGESEVKKRKLPIWRSTNENIPEDTRHKTAGDNCANKDKGKILRGSSNNTANANAKLASDNEAKSNISSKEVKKLNCSSSPGSSSQPGKHQDSNNSKGISEGNLPTASHSSGRDGHGSSAQDKETDHLILGTQNIQNATSFSTLLEGVVLAISGLVNPERGNLRSQALEMGAEYQPDWNSKCTLLVCAFRNTPKYKQVKDDNGSIVSKEWITECYKQKKLLDIDPYLMHAGKPWRKRNSSNSSYMSDNAVMGKQQEKIENKFQLDKRSVSDVVTENKPREANAMGIMKLDFNPSEVQRWAREDLNVAMSWLQDQKEKPHPSEIKETAIQGIIVCLEDTIKCLKENKDVCAMLDSWEFIPQIVKELVAFEKGKKDAQMLSTEELCRMADNFKSIYETEFKNMSKAMHQQQGKNKLESEQQLSGTQRNGKLVPRDNIKVQHQDDDDSDDATEVMSDDGSEEEADIDTDDVTQVMDEDELLQAEENITQKWLG